MDQSQKSGGSRSDESDRWNILERKLLAASQSPHRGSCKDKGGSTASTYYFTDVASRNQTVSVLVHDRAAHWSVTDFRQGRKFLVGKTWIAGFQFSHCDRDS